MARPDKVAAVAEIADEFRGASASVVTEYRGLTVAQLTTLRRTLGPDVSYRIAKNTLVKRAAQDVLARMHKPDPLLDLAMQLEEIALADDFFVSRQLYPNVDFYTGLIYKAMGFPTRMFTVLFALGRLPGWIAQWREMLGDPANKLGRPRQVYTGAPERGFIPIDLR